MKMKFYALWLSAFIIFIFILQRIFPIITGNFMLISSEVLIRPWILLTSIFLHSNILHLIYNLFALALFGTLLEKIIGSKKFILLFIISGVLAGIGSCFIYNAALGASGAIFGILGCLIILRPKGVVFVYGLPMPLFIAAFVWIALDIFGLFAPDNIANLAHLVGLAIGLIYGCTIRKKYIQKIKPKQKIEIDESLIEEWERTYMKK